LKSFALLSVEKDKSKIIFRKTCLNKDFLSRLISIPEGFLPCKYLGLPLSINYLKAKDYSSLIDKCKAKLEGWSSHPLFCWMSSICAICHIWIPYVLGCKLQVSHFCYHYFKQNYVKFHLEGQDASMQLGVSAGQNQKEVWNQKASGYQ